MLWQRGPTSFFYMTPLLKSLSSPPPNWTVWTVFSRISWPQTQGLWLDSRLCLTDFTYLSLHHIYRCVNQSNAIAVSEIGRCEYSNIVLLALAEVFLEFSGHLVNFCKKLAVILIETGFVNIKLSNPQTWDVFLFRLIYFFQQCSVVLGV
jgi:hypothetical protein